MPSDSADSGCERAIVKITYDDYFSRTGHRFNPFKGGFWSRLGWSPSRIDLPGLHSLPSQSLHIEFESPRGLEVDGLALAVTDTIRDLDVIEAADSQISRHSDLAHVFVPSILPQYAVSGSVYLRLELTPEVWTVFLASGLLTLALFFGSLAPGRVVARGAELMFLVPGVVIGALLSRQHELVTRLSSNRRWLLMATAGLSAVAVAIAVFADGASMAESRSVGYAFGWLTWPSVLALLFQAPVITRSWFNRIPTPRLRVRRGR